MPNPSWRDNRDLPRLFRLCLIISLLVAGMVMAGCGQRDGAESQAVERPTPARPPEKLILSLDFVPNAVHSPIYQAVREGHDRANGVALDIQKPSGGPDALKLVSSGRVDLGVLDIHDLAIARQQGTDLVAIGALIDKPLAALIAQPGIERPRDLEGRTVGVSGLPSDPAFLRAIIEHDGGEYSKIRTVTIGFTAVTRILSGRVDAVPAFWNVEGVALRERGIDVNAFRVEDYGAPPYPEVVLITARRTLEDKRDALERTLDAIEAGRQETLEHPERAAKVIAEAAESRDAELIRAQLDAVSPVFAENLALDRGVLEKWATFDERIGIVRRRPDIDRAFDFSLRDPR